MNRYLREDLSEERVKRAFAYIRTCDCLYGVGHGQPLYVFDLSLARSQKFFPFFTTFDFFCSCHNERLLISMLDFPANTAFPLSNKNLFLVVMAKKKKTKRRKKFVS